MGERDMGFGQSMALKIVALIIGIVALITAYIGFATKVTPEAGSSSSSSSQSGAGAGGAAPAVSPEQSPGVGSDGGPPYYDARGNRIDSNGQPCGNGPYGHDYNAAQECWVP